MLSGLESCISCYLLDVGHLGLFVRIFSDHDIVEEYSHAFDWPGGIDIVSDFEHFAHGSTRHWFEYFNYYVLVLYSSSFFTDCLWCLEK